MKLHSYKATTTLEYFSTFLCAILNDMKLSLSLKDVRNVQILEDLKLVICILQAAVRQIKHLRKRSIVETPTSSLLRVSKFCDCYHELLATLQKKCNPIQLHSYKEITTFQCFTAFLCAILDDRKLSWSLRMWETYKCLKTLSM